MPITIKPTEMRYRDEEGEYHGLNAVAERTTAEMIAQVAESIPQDYSTLSSTVAGLVTDVGHLDEVCKTLAASKISGTDDDYVITVSGV